MILGAFHSILVGTLNGTDHFGLVPGKYWGAALKATLTGPVMSVGRSEMSLSICQNCCPQYRSFVSFVSCLQEQ